MSLRYISIYLASIIIYDAMLSANAQTPLSVDQALATATVDLNVPQSPALAVLGVSAEEAFRPKRPRELALSLANGTVKDGKLNAGLAVDTAPYLLFKEKDLTLNQYQQGWRRLISNTELSFATASVGDNDSEGVAAALGLRLNLLDKGDPYWEYSEASIITCFENDIGREWTKAQEVRDDTGNVIRDISAERGEIRDIVENLLAKETIREVQKIKKKDDSEEDLSKKLYKELDKKWRKLDTEWREIASDIQQVAATTDQLAQEKEKRKSLDDFLNSLDALTKDKEDLVADYHKAYAPLVEFDGKATKLAAECKKIFRKKTWNASNIAIGLVPTWTSETSSYDDLKWSGASLYATAAYGFEGNKLFEDSAQLIGHVRYRSDEIVPDKSLDSGSFEQDTLVLAIQGRAALGEALLSDGKVPGPDFNIFADLGFINADRQGRPDDDFFRWSVGTEYAIFENSYFQISVGSDIGSDDDSGLIFGALKIGLSDEASYSPRKTE